MTPTRPAVILLLTFALSTGAQTQQKPRPSKPPEQSTGINWHAEGRGGLVVGGAGPESVDVGLSILKAGGNAFDAAAATLLALTVTDAENFAFGSEVAILYYDARRDLVESIAGQGAAPGLATREHFAGKGGIPTSGIESAAVPGALDAIITLLDRQGTLPFAQAVAPTLRILERDEFPWHADLARHIRGMIAAEATARDRRDGLRRVSDYFYRGPVARQIDEWSRANGGLLRYMDLATHVTRMEPPVRTAYRGHLIFKCGAWTQGPSLLQAMSLLDYFDLKAPGHNSADSIHLATEALKLALADRDWWLGDPRFSEIPWLFEGGYIEARKNLIDLQRASQRQRPGNLGPLGRIPVLPPPKVSVVNDTTTCLVADQHGNVVAATPSGWSGVLAGGTGVWLGSRLQSFNFWEGHPNCIEPAKRPRITLTPTIVLKDGKPIMAVSVAGGDAQDQVTLQVLVNMIDFNMQPAEAVTAPRFLTHHFISSFGQKPPELGSLYLNAEIPESVVNDLKSRGHNITIQQKYIWDPTALRIDPQTRLLRGAGDPKAKRKAGAY